MSVNPLHAHILVNTGMNLFTWRLEHYNNKDCIIILTLLGMFLAWVDELVGIGD